MTTLHPQLIPPYNNQREYLLHLQQIGHPFASIYNSENPLPSALETADKFEREGKIWDVISRINGGAGSLGIILFWGLYYSGKDHPLSMLIGPFIVLIAIGTLIEKRMSTLKRKASMLRRQFTLVTYHEDLLWRYQEFLTTFRITISFSRERIVQTLKQRIRDDLDIHFKTFVPLQNEHFQKHKISPEQTKWDTGQIECLFLPLFFPIVDEFGLEVFRFEIAVTVSKPLPVNPPTVGPIPGSRSDYLQITGLVYCGDVDE